MKKIVFLLTLVFPVLNSSFAQVDSTSRDNNPNSKEINTPIEKIKIGIPKIQFKHYTHDFGHIPQGIPVSFEFEFLNNGTDKVSIIDAKSSCGCTAPEWNNEQVTSGQSGKIKAIYNSATIGKFNKNITVTFSNGNSEVLVIKGYVDPPPYTPPSPTLTPGSPLVVPEY